MGCLGESQEELTTETQGHREEKAERRKQGFEPLSLFVVFSVSLCLCG
jgi:hypothetical protein